jgi:putative endonuclease
VAGEATAVRELGRRGYRIVERNFRCRAGELDVIALDGDVLVFVEVRARRDGARGTGVEAVGYAKQRQVTRVAEIYLAMRGLRPARCRFDVVGITGDRVEVIVDAWRPGLP